DKLGCEIGNHTWDHVNLTTVSGEAAAETVKRTSDAVEKITGKSTPVYRPCFGAYNDAVLSSIQLPAIMWSLDTLDWKTKNAESNYERLMNGARDGVIVLMHDIHQPTVEAVCRAIPELIEQGYQLVTVSELLEYRFGGGENGKVYFGSEE
ncbi:MAG: polysaccharide deacetylase family protein, partial [Clostridia bacterium]